MTRRVRACLLLHAVIPTGLLPLGRFFSLRDVCAYWLTVAALLFIDYRIQSPSQGARFRRA
jgi:hypothetical protein